MPRCVKGEISMLDRRVEKYMEIEYQQLVGIKTVYKITEENKSIGIGNGWRMIL
jgi:hypothetical protein